MSRSGYSDDCDGWALIRWRGAVASAIRGKRGQAFLRETLAALDALPEKTLAADSLVTDCEFCTLGAVGRLRGLDMTDVDPDDPSDVALAFGIPRALAAEIMFENDEGVGDTHRGSWVDVEVCGPMPRYQSHHRCIWVENPRAGEVRWAAMRAWVARRLNDEAFG